MGCCRGYVFRHYIKTIKNMKTGSNTAFSELIKNYKFKNSNGRDINPSKICLHPDSGCFHHEKYLCSQQPYL